MDPLINEFLIQQWIHFGISALVLPNKRKKGFMQKKRLMQKTLLCRKNY
jgi:hypothetical protein